ncbi:uncharacterized protein LOC127846407 isoform X1 [Dreissena polymorpha]|uniref:uncharacterized protein LOC127846407 isoform X1 n=1 Tax=Dreissena polymorpha TaxID=45954 RepID=UPI002264BE18|nr:uncharacterized protein LOC127846407 isoform X1 [Dreissena polymorpha]
MADKKSFCKNADSAKLVNGCTEHDNEIQENGVLDSHLDVHADNDSDFAMGGSCMSHHPDTSEQTHGIGLQRDSNRNKETHKKATACKKLEPQSESDQDAASRMKLFENNNGINVRHSGYSATVCDVYRHENDVIFGRTRGGDVHSSPVTVIVSPHVQQNRVVVFRNELSQLDQSSPVDIPYSHHINGEALAPLATPESFSDEEPINAQERLHEDLFNLHEEIEHLNTAEDEKPNISESEHNTNREVVECSDIKSEHCHNEFDRGGNLVSVPECQQMSSSESNLSSVHSEDGEVDNVTVDSVVHIELEQLEVYNEEFTEKDDGNDVDEGNASDNSVGLDNNDNEMELEEIEEAEGAVNVSLPEDVNGDDVGDFIEADLPPNVERLAFFSRDSSSDEDEGCGDEVLLANEEVVSDNETIDPTLHVFDSPKREDENKIRNDKKLDFCNMLSNSLSERGQLFDSEMFACNISCDKLSEENDLDVDEMSMISESEGLNRARECSNCAFQTPNRNLSFGDSNSAVLNGCNICACCDRPFVLDKERHKEMGIDVCDKCFKIHSIEQQNVWSENFNGARRKSHKCSNLTPRNSSYSLSSYNNTYEKRSNTTPFARFSSSDSESYDRVFMSDSPEMSPDPENRQDLVFQVDNMADIAHRPEYQQNGSYALSERNHMGMHGHSMSQELASPEEDIYCPFFTRRTQSLDQDLAIGGDDRGSPCDMSGMEMTRSNFNINESNSHENEFENGAYSISQQTSSDEEENIRLPGHITIEPGAASNHDVQSMCIGHEQDIVSNMDYVFENGFVNVHRKSSKLRLEDTEPIYEDIDQLLWEEVCTEGEKSNRPAFNSKVGRACRSRSPVGEVAKVMIWKEYEAYLVQVKQIGTSACGPTAVLNVLKAFDFQVDKEEVTKEIRSNLRMEGAPIPYYLFSRYNAGTTAEDLIEGITRVTRGAIRGRFFHFYPQRDVDLLKWLGHWIKMGAVPLATLNLQKGVKPGWTIPDAWHHQMVYGVSSKGVYLTNPLEIVPESVIMEQLTSDSVLLVRRQDVVTRFRDWCPLNEIIQQRDPRWCTLNVLGQVVHMLREQCMPADQLLSMKCQLTSHIQIPAAYKAGISLFMRANSDNIDDLMNAPELPLKQEPAKKY